MKLVSRILLTAVVAQVLLVGSFVSAASPAKRGTNTKINSNALSQKSTSSFKPTQGSFSSQNSSLNKSSAAKFPAVSGNGKLGSNPGNFKPISGNVTQKNGNLSTKIGKTPILVPSKGTGIVPLNPSNVKPGLVNKFPGSSKLPGTGKLTPIPGKIDLGQTNGTVPIVKFPGKLPIGNTPMLPVKPGQVFPGQNPANPGNPPADPGNPPADPGNPPADPGNPPANPGNPPQAPHCHPCPPICLPPIWIGHHYCPPFIVGVCQPCVPGVVVVPSAPVVVPVVVEETPAQPVLQLIVGQTALLSKDGLASMPAAAALELNEIGLPMAVTMKDDNSFSFDVPLMGLSQPKTATLYLFDAQMKPLAAIPVQLVTAEMVAGVSQ